MRRWKCCLIILSESLDKISFKLSLLDGYWLDRRCETDIDELDIEEIAIDKTDVDWVR